MIDPTNPKKKSGYCIEELQAIVTAKSSGRVKLLTPAKLGSKDNYHFLCLECDTEFKKTMAGFRRTRPGNSGCPQCGKPKNAPQYTREDVVAILAKDGYQLLSEDYQSVSTKVMLKCPNPEHPEYPTTIDKFLSGSRCPYSGGCRVTFAHIKFYVESPERITTHQARFRLLTEEDSFVNSTKTDLTIDCLDCNHPTFVRSWISFSNAASPSGCPYCSQERTGSWSATLMTNLLTAAKLHYEVEQTFPGLVSPNTKYPLRFDLYVPEASTLIEVDGIQHFMKCKYGSQTWDEAAEQFRKSQKYDALKDRFIENHDELRLLRLPLFNATSNRPYSKPEVIASAVDMVTAIHRELRGTDPVFKEDDFVLDRGKLTWAKDKVFRETDGKVSFIDTSYFGMKGWYYLFKCNSVEEHGSFQSVLDSTPPRCPLCSRQSMRERHHLGREEAEARIKEKHGERISFVDEEYVNIDHKHRFRCTEHGEYEATLTTVLKTRSGSCPGCSPKPFCHGVAPNGFTAAHFSQVIAPAVALEPDYNLLTTADEHSGGQSYLRISHTKCGREFEMRWEAWRLGSRCPDCRPPKVAANRSDETVVKSKVAAAHGGGYRLDVPFRGMRERHDITHLPSGTGLLATIDNFLRGKFARPK